MGFFSWILLGLIAGILAKWIMPGKDGGGFIMTTLLGVIGSFAGGYIGSLLGMGTTQSFSMMGILTATVGALIVLFIYKAIFNKA
jgi:uncharacterized membrane protein YeaQ/YmgE (transglycosylase-associated protein family)